MVKLPTHFGKKKVRKKMSSEKKKIIIADRYTTIKSLKPIKDCNVCDYQDGYTCWDHEHEQIKKIYPNVKYTDDLEWVVYE